VGSIKSGSLNSRGLTDRNHRSEFLIPVAMTILLLLMIPISAKLLIGVEPSIISTIAQALVFMMLAFLLYISIQKRYHAKSEIQELDKVLNAQYDLDYKQNNFMNAISKDLQPAVTEMWSFLESPEVPEQSKKFIEAGLKEISETIETFGFVAKLDSRSVKNEKSAESLVDIVRGVEGSVSKGARSIKIDVPENAKVRHRQMIEKVLFALVSNSLEHSGDKGSIYIEYKTRLKTRRSEIIVKDNGKGVPKDKLALLFKPLTRVEDTKEFSHQGRGMSLFVSRMVMRYIGGDLIAQSELGKGTKMTIVLPKN